MYISCTRYKANVLHNNRLKMMALSAFHCQFQIPSSSAEIFVTNRFLTRTDDTSRPLFNPAIQICAWILVHSILGNTEEIVISCREAIYGEVALACLAVGVTRVFVESL